MIENLRSYLSAYPVIQRHNRLREYVHWLILKAIDEKGLRHKIAFVGGTALRVVFKTNRFSEDLDFSLVSADFPPAGEFADLLQSEMTRCGIESNISNLKADRNVISFFLKFPNLLYPLQISPHKGQVLSVKIEADRNPPSGWKVQEYLFTDPLMFWITHYDLPSLFAGKLHAFFYRGYDKGRDYYDLLFFLRNKVQLNFDFFQHAAAQTHPQDKYVSAEQVFARVSEKLQKTNMANVRKEVIPFLLEPSEDRFLTAETILKLIEQGKYESL